MVPTHDVHAVGGGWLRPGASVLPVPPHLARAFAPATICLREWTEYYLEYPGADGLRVGDELSPPVAGGVFRLRFENQLGLARLQACEDGRPLHPPVWAEVVSPKFPKPEAHLLFYRALLDDLFARAARLPFAISSDTSRGVAEAPRPPTPLFALHFLTHYARELEDALAVVLGAPHSLLLDHPERVPLADAAEADADVLLEILRSPEEWVPARGFALATKLGGYAPARVWQRLPEETYDTPENRFALAFLRDLLSATESLPGQRWWGSVPQARRAAVLRVGAVLRRGVGQAMFDGVGPMLLFPSASHVLQRREGYRNLLRLWRLYNQARRPLFEPLRQAMEVRNVAALYELWAFFALAEEIAAITTEAPVGELALSDAAGLGRESKVRFGSVGELVYNQSFPRSPRRENGSYSVLLRPDFTWRVGGRPEVVLDAKFRLDRAAMEAGDDTSTATPLKADLYKMHTYRDALGVRAAVTVYPGDEALFYDAQERTGAGVTLQEVLCEGRSGIGALPMRPVSLQEEE